jgi:transcriptional regulator with XRE-family HTH domain
MPTLAAYRGMMQRARKREGLRVCRASWLVGISIREYREIEAGDREPSPDTYERISELYGWPRTFVGRPKAPPKDSSASGRRGRPRLRPLLKDVASHVPYREMGGAKAAERVRVRVLASISSGVMPAGASLFWTASRLRRTRVACTR